MQKMHKNLHDEGRRRRLYLSTAANKKDPSSLTGLGRFEVQNK